jgi:hypothetical protein
MAGRQELPRRGFPVAIEFYRLVLAVLVVWRATHLFQAEDGPWDLIVRLREWAGQGLLGEVLDCFYCLSLWVAIPAAVLAGHNWKQQLVLWPALSGGAIILERMSSKNEATSPVIYAEDKYSLEKENENVLRERQSSTESHFETSKF